MHCKGIVIVQQSILILSKERYPYLNDFVLEGKKRNVNVDVKFFDDIHIEFTKTQTKIFIGNIPIEQYTLIYIRTTGMYVELQTLISEYCRMHNVPLVDTSRTFKRPWIDTKSFELMKLSQHNIPIVESVFVSLKNVELVKTLVFPCVVKITDVDCGNGVFLCASFEEIKDKIKEIGKHVLVQSFIPNDGDVRIIVIGNKIIGAMKRVAVDKDEFRNNVSQGGSVFPYEASEQQKKMALLAVKSLQYDIAGVDIIFDKKDNTWKILEVNISPQFTSFEKVTGINIKAKIMEYLVSRLPKQA